MQKKASCEGDYCLNIFTELLKCKFQMEIATVVIFLRPSEYTQRKQSIDTTGCKAVIVQKVKVSLRLCLLCESLTFID